MSWKEVRPGRFERPLDAIEILFKKIADQGVPLNREHGAVRVYAQFQYHASSSKTELALRKTWMTMRHDHPELASYVDEASKVYEVPSPRSLEDWMAETFHVERSATAQQLFSQTRPSRLSTIYYLPQTSEILISSSHWRIDGVGALCLLNSFFKTLARPRHTEFGNEWKNLAPGLGEAAKLSRNSTIENLQAATRRLKEYSSNVPSLGLPIPAEERTPNETRLLRITFSATSTSAVVDACRTQGYSVTTALHAALIVATQQLASQDESSRRYTSWGPINLRPFVDAYSDAHSHPVSVCLIAFPITITPSTFMNNAAQLKSIYKHFASPQHAAFELETCLMPYLKEAASLLNQPPSGEFSPPTEPMLDSLGIVDRYLQREHANGVEIVDFWLATETLSKQLTVYAWTWQGQLVLSTCYNVAFYERDFVKSFLQRMKRILLLELNIEFQQDDSDA